MWSLAVTVAFAVAAIQALPKCPLKSQSPPELVPGVCISKAWSKRFQPNLPETLCIRTKLRCGVDRTKESSNSSMVSFECFTEVPSGVRFSMERTIRNASLTEHVRNISLVYMSICITRKGSSEGANCGISYTPNTEAIWSNYFSVEVDLTPLGRRSEVSLQNCSCSYYERFHENQWRLCQVPVDRKQLPGLSVICGSVVLILVGISVLIWAINESTIIMTGS